MEYQLAKELKESGFPQKEFKFHNGYEGQWPSDVQPAKWPYNPTLEELIEACGYKLIGLLRHDDESGWTALKHGDDLFLPKTPLAIAPTPTEAVARLWLALNKKV